MTHTEAEIEAVWKKGKVVSGRNPDILRQDACTAWIKRSEYGNRDSDNGWEIDHIDPNGPDNISNWQPLQWENNVSKSDGSLICKKVAATK